MTRKTVIVLVCAALAAGCHRQQNLKRGNQDYQVVQEGQASGVTSTINGPGETPPPVTDTSIDTTTNFTLPDNPAPMGSQPQNGGTIAGTLPSYPTGYPSAPPPRPRTVQPTPQPAPPMSSSSPAPQPQPTPQAQPQPAPPPTDTTASDQQQPPPTDTTATQPPPPDEKKAKKDEKKKEGEQTDTSSTTTTSTAPPPPPPPV